MQMQRKMKGRLQLKFLSGLLVLAIVLIAVLGFVITGQYRTSMENYYAKVAFDEAKIAAETINGDTIAHYAQTLTKDDYYTRINRTLLRIKQTVGIKYFYVVIPYEDKMFYIWDAGAPDEEGICELGTREDYYGGGKEIMRGAFLNPNGARTILITNNDTYGYLASAYVAILDSKGQAVALSCVDISIDMINRQIHSFMLAIILVIGGILTFFVAGYFVVIRYSVLRPLDRLSQAAETLISEKMGALASFEVDVKTGDEIEALADAFSHMAHELHRYIENLSAVTAEKERIGAELDVAKHIQASMLPCVFPAFPERHELDIYATMTPAKEVGGDFYDFFLVDDDHLAMVMADVSGKGVPAALFMVIAKTLLKNSAQTGLSPRAVLEKVNCQLCENNDAEMFVTVWLGILEISTGKVVCANAGHEYPVIKRAHGDYELIKDKHGFVLAGMESARYKEYELQLYSGDRLFLYTDGVPEATDIQNSLFGVERMLVSLNSHKEAGCEALLQLVKQDIDAFVGQAPQFDDITMLTLELKVVEGQTMKKIKLTPSLEAMEELTAFVEQILEAAEVPIKVISQINIAVDEIFSNIVQYSGARDVTVGCLADNEKVMMRFADNGRPYDPTAKLDPDITLSADARDTGGLGIYMVKKMMDHVLYEYCDGFNILKLTKFISRK